MDFCYTFMNNYRIFINEDFTLVEKIEFIFLKKLNLVFTFTCWTIHIKFENRENLYTEVRLCFVVMTWSVTLNWASKSRCWAIHSMDLLWNLESLLITYQSEVTRITPYILYNLIILIESRTLSYTVHQRT